jgi:hypothetical protein
MSATGNGREKGNLVAIAQGHVTLDERAVHGAPDARSAQDIGKVWVQRSDRLAQRGRSGYFTGTATGGVFQAPEKHESNRHGQPPVIDM